MAASSQAGPLDIEITGRHGPLLDLIHRTLELYDVPWSLTPMKRVSLNVAVTYEPSSQTARGTFLECAQMLVDTVSGGLLATTTGRARLSGDFRDGVERWDLSAPESLVAAGRWPEIEDLISLVVTTGWRRAQWVPLHAAGLTDGDRGLLVCAMSGGGKTTFSLALVRNGWQMLGDDKLLIGQHNGELVAGAIKQILNLDPAVVRWFPEVGDLRSLPEYSTWSPKRRVPLTRFWPRAAARVTRPTHVIVVDRRPDSGSVQVQPLSEGDTMAALMRQTVVPLDPTVAQPVLAALATVARRVRGFRVEIPDDAYADPHAMDTVEAAIS